MRQRHERVVVDGDAGAARIESRVDAADRAEQQQRLIDQVAAEIEQQPAGFIGRRRASASRPSRPDASARSATRSGRRRRAAPSAISRCSVRKSPSQRRLWKTVSSVPCARAASMTRRRVGRRGGDRLVDHDRETGVDRGHGQRNVRAIRRGNDHDVQRPRRRPQRLGVRQAAAASGMRRGGLRAPGGIRRDDSGQPQARRRRNQRAVEDGAGMTVADERDAESPAAATSA